ncbi:MAG: hypothetical protein ACXAB8_15235 [Promethearchaeota archaeon]|jgi:hypothetical protein
MIKDMSRAALSVFIMGIYLIFLGITFLFFPEMMFAILAEPNPPDVVSRVLGMIFVLLAYYYIRAALEGGEGMKKFFMWTVHTRASVIIFLIIFAALSLTSPLIVLFGVIDLVMAIWTFWELRKEKK